MSKISKIDMINTLIKNNRLKWVALFLCVVAILFVVSYKIAKRQVFPGQESHTSSTEHTGTDEEGHVIHSYVVDVITPLATVAPQEYREVASISKFPIYENAQELSALTWETNDSFAQVAQWYSWALEDLGWESTSLVNDTKTDSELIVHVARSTQKVELRIVESDGITMIQVSKYR